MRGGGSGWNKSCLSSDTRAFPTVDGTYIWGFIMYILSFWIRNTKFTAFRSQLGAKMISGLYLGHSFFFLLLLLSCLASFYFLKLFCRNFSFAKQFLNNELRISEVISFNPIKLWEHFIWFRLFFHSFS